MDKNAHRLALAKRLKEALEEAEISPADMARRAEVTAQAVQGWFDTGRISKTNLARVAQETGEDLDYLMSGVRAPRKMKTATARGRGDYKGMLEPQDQSTEEAALLTAFRKLSADGKVALLAIATMLAGCVSLSDVDVTKYEPGCARQCTSDYSKCVSGLQMTATATYYQCKQGMNACLQTCPPK